jgi:uncharacterized protein YuzE
MNIKYDKKMDALHITLKKGAYYVSKKITDSILVDTDKEGNAIGIEILDASETVDEFDPQKIIQPTVVL